MSDSDATTIPETQDLKDSIDKNNPINEQNYFFESKSTKPSSKKGKRRKKNSYLRKPVRLFPPESTKRQNENYLFTVIQHRKIFGTTKILTMIVLSLLSFTQTAFPLVDKYNFAII